MVVVASRDPLRLNSDATSKWERDTHFLERELGDQKEKQALIKSWLGLCVKEHSDACRDTHDTEEEFKKLIKENVLWGHRRGGHAAKVVAHQKGETGAVRCADRNATKQFHFRG
jgi:hypothetical protein